MFKESLLLLLTLSVVHSQVSLTKDFDLGLPKITLPTFPDIYGNNPSNSSCKLDCGWNTISVSGSSALDVNPDIASINIVLSQNGDTSNAAISKLSKKIPVVLSALTKNGLNSSNWQTTSLNVYPNTSYVDGKQVIYGQIAEQRMVVNIPIVGSSGSSVGVIYDTLAQISGISINDLTFDLKDKTSSFVEARRLAFLDAAQKAKDYASAASITLGSVQTITDSYNVAPVTIPNNQPRFFAAAMKTGVQTTVSLGTIKIDYNVNVIYSYA